MRMQRFSVEPIWPQTSFPLDMLRHDACWPRNSEDAATIVLAGTPDEPARAVIHLTGITPPSVGRWSSFGWRVVT